MQKRVRTMRLRAEAKAPLWGWFLDLLDPVEDNGECPVVELLVALAAVALERGNNTSELLWFDADVKCVCFIGVTCI